MTDFDYPDIETGNTSAGRPGRSPLGGLSLQTGASILLIAVIAAVLLLFFGPAPFEGESGLPTATPGILDGTAPVVTATNSITGGIGSSVLTPVFGTLAPPDGNMTPAPVSAQVAVDGFVAVANTEGYGARYRFGPGPDYLTIRILDEGETLRVVGGPEVSGGFTWWRVQDALGNVGWAAQEFLLPAQSPPAWSPPLASPTFPAQQAPTEP